MRANVGDELVVRGHHVGDENREAVIIEVHGEEGTPPYLVRWRDGHESVFFPPPTRRSSTIPVAANQPAARHSGRLRRWRWRRPDKAKWAASQRGAARGPQRPRAGPSLREYPDMADGPANGHDACLSGVVESDREGSRPPEKTRGSGGSGSVAPGEGDPHVAEILPVALSGEALVGLAWLVTRHPGLRPSGTRACTPSAVTACRWRGSGCRWRG